MGEGIREGFIAENAICGRLNPSCAVFVASLLLSAYNLELLLRDSVAEKRELISVGFSSAGVALVSSMKGRHKGKDLDRLGHMCRSVETHAYGQCRRRGRCMWGCGLCLSHHCYGYGSSYRGMMTAVVSLIGLSPDILSASHGNGHKCGFVGRTNGIYSGRSVIAALNRWSLQEKIDNN